MSYALPGEVMLEVDLSDIREDASELRGVCALIALMLLMYDANSTWSNVTTDSMTLIQSAIVRFGTEKRALNPRAGPADPIFHLNNYRYKNDADDTLQWLQVQNGMGGMNCRRQMPVEDPVREFYLRAGTRINYAIDRDDFRIFKNEVNDTNEWPIVKAISDFISKCVGMTTLSGYFQVVAANIQAFHVRQNDHFRTYWYNIFRNSQATQCLRNINESERLGVKAKIHGKTLLHLHGRCEGAPLIPKYKHYERVQIESGFIRSMRELGAKLEIVNSIVRELDVEEEFSIPSRVSLANKGNVFTQYFCEILDYTNELRFADGVFVDHFLRNDLTLCFAPLYTRKLCHFADKGVLTRFVAKIEVNAIDRRYHFS